MSPAPSRPFSSPLPALLLAAYALAFAGAALGPGLVYDDHPGQLYRVAHAATRGLAPWRWNPGWWAGYAELQFYPPGFAYLGALIHHVSLGAISVDRAYQAVVWIAYVLPGVTTFALLRRVLRDPWLALPGAFVALTLSAGSRSGVEEGVRWGLVAARLGWGLLPLLARSLVAWVEGAPRMSPWTAPLLAAVVLTHPAHAPAGVAMLALAAVLAPPSTRPRLGAAAVALLTALGLAAFWILPLLARHHLALALAWGDATPLALIQQVASQPLLVLLAAASTWALIHWRRLLTAGRSAAWLAALPPPIAAIVLLAAAVARPLDLAVLPADRLMDSLLLALILAGSQAVWLLPGAATPARARGAGLALVALAVVLGLYPRPSEPTLTLVPGARQWPTYGAVASGLRLEELWTALAHAPPGRILFLRSAVPLEYRPEWWRPHTHVTALAPLRSGRDILGGTFTHPSPVASVLYTGRPGPGAVTRLAEERDGITLFGRPLEHLSPADFRELAEQFRIGTVVALDEDIGRLPFLADASGFGPPQRQGPFLVFLSHSPRPLPEAPGPERRRLALHGHPGGWTSTGLAYSPLWTARAGEARLATAPDDLGLLAVNAPAGEAVTLDLIHGPGWAEWAGLAISSATLASALMAAARRRRRPA